MLYMKLDAADRQELIANLEAMPGFLEDTFAGLSPQQVTLPGPQGSFSPVEHVWHLADLEREGFAVRIDRLQREQSPHLPDFDGTAVAHARRYRSLSIAEGLRAFRAARMDNLQKLREIRETEWPRGGTLEQVGPVSLCDIPSMLRQHDATHKEEIARWHESNRSK